LILQLGYILHTVPTWNRSFKLRVMVFVEYESELDEEGGRVRALLEKLRIDAEVHVFWLASGLYATYEAIVQGRFHSHETEDHINEVLRVEDWWQDLKRLRGAATPMDGSQELASRANVLGSTVGRPGVYNPHGTFDDGSSRRRSSVALVGEIPKKPTMSALSKMGVSMGIHTQSLGRGVFNLDSDSDGGDGQDSDSDSSDAADNMDADFNDVDNAASEADLDEFVVFKRPVWSLSRRRKSHGDLLAKRPVPRRKRTDDDLLLRPGASGQRSYGTMARTESCHDPLAILPKLQVDTNAQPSGRGTASARSSSPVAGSSQKMDAAIQSAPLSAVHSTTNLQRPSLLRTASSSIRFSSSLVPETKITNVEGGGGPTISFAETDVPRPSRPGFSRTNSAKTMPSRPSELRLTAMIDDERPVTPSMLEVKNKKSVAFKTDGGDAHVDIRAAVAQYHSQVRHGTIDDSEPYHDSDDSDGGGSGSSYATQDLPLSFNDLPNRAQHLILNELMRQNSEDTAVLFTTLPIPEEGTGLSEEASVLYLSDVEVLCHELPPTLMVLSNNMTVTVSL